MRMDKLLVGDRVRLNARGYKALLLQSRQAFEQACDMLVTSVKNVGTEDCPLYVVRVDKPLIDRYIVWSEYLDRIEKPAKQKVLS